MNHTSRLQHEQALENRLAMRLGAALAERAEASPRDVTERLRVAREQAVARARELRTASAARLPTAPAVLSSSGPVAMLGAPTRWWQRAASVLPLVTLLLGLLLVNRMAEMEQVEAAAEIDAALLADTLPPDAYADPGFAEYLRSPPP